MYVDEQPLYYIRSTGVSHHCHSAREYHHWLITKKVLNLLQPEKKHTHFLYSNHSLSPVLTTIVLSTTLLLVE
jgi:hypothetical protein